METVVELRNKEELVEHIRQLLSAFAGDFEFDKIEVRPYGGVAYETPIYDKRIGWTTYVVTMPGYGVLGFTDGPL